MSDDRFDVLERFERLVQAPESSFEGFLRRRDRKLRNQRIAAGVVAIAIFVTPISWIVATSVWSGRTQTTVGNGPTVAPDDADRVGLVGLAPEGATPSTPRRGELVLRFMFGHTMGDPGRFSVFVYADGRLIWERLGDRTGGADEYAKAYTTGLLEQRLTPGGVELVRAEVISTGLFDNDLLLASGPLNFGQIEVRNGDRLVRVTWGDCCDPGQEDVAREIPTPEQVSALQQLDARLADPASWLPASAWEDPEITAYVPSRYSVCYEPQGAVVGLSRVLALLPDAAADLLRSQDRRREESPLLESFVLWCSDLRTEEARTLARILDDAGVGTEDVFGLRYVFGQRDPGATEVSLSFAPLLPHQR